MSPSQTGIVTANQANIRLGPSSTSEVIVNAFEGNRFPVLSEEGDWYRIQMADNNIGYIHKSLISLDEEKSAPAPENSPDEEKPRSEGSTLKPIVKEYEKEEKPVVKKYSEEKKQMEVAKNPPREEASKPEPATPNTSVANIVEAEKAAEDKETFQEESNKPKSATIIVYSEPLRAQIYLDDELIGNTPLSKSIPIGNHIIILKKSGFRDWPYKITLSADEKKSIKATLTAN